MNNRPLILITNDDGIESPGLHASVAALADLGDLLIIAPKQQQTGSGRSYPRIKDAAIYPITVTAPAYYTDKTREYSAYMVDMTPAQTVDIGVLDLATRPIDVCVSGINYGENIGSGITASGTVGAALEAAILGIPSLAMSLETLPQYHFNYSNEIDFRASAHFTRYFTQQVLSQGLPPKTDLLKIDVPSSATMETAWRTARVSRQSYYVPLPSGRTELNEQKPLGYTTSYNPDTLEPDSDIYITMIDKQVAVVPIQIDMTAENALSSMDQLYRNGGKQLC
ncbi:5'/3'-nucleotidase SurE [Anaerolineales bacterium HSG25]|nr:5'/3'-nucleotidase SurE [Anaerolineales bacterium HSG25]